MRLRPRSRGLQQDGSTRNPESGIPVVLTGAGKTTAQVRFPGEDAGRSLAAMAQRDLDAALQLLADRAQFITGASGAAIALKRSGKSDMLCRASTGSNAPELGALLSTEFGLSGESVRTKRPLRCDDAERDGRVNREVCRQLGIASVVVMPVVHDDEVLGVFELFSGRAHAFGERDLSAVRRLSEMVETAVRMAQVTEKLPERMVDPEKTESAVGSFDADEEILEVEIPEIPVQPALEAEPAKSLEVLKNAAPVLEAPPAPEVNAVVDATSLPKSEAQEQVQEAPAPAVTEQETEQEPEQAPSMALAARPESPLPKKKLFWSASLDGTESDKASEDQSHVPPVLRGLHKCEACGFPVSAGRVLCVECEEKKWRGQLRKPRPSIAVKPIVSQVAQPKAEAKAFAAAAPASVVPAVIKVPVAPAAPPKRVDSTSSSTSQPPAAQALTASSSERAAEEPLKIPIKPPELVLSAAMEPSQSWLGSHKYIVAVLIAVALVVAVVFFTR